MDIKDQFHLKKKKSFILKKFLLQKLIKEKRPHISQKSLENGLFKAPCSLLLSSLVFFALF